MTTVSKSVARSSAGYGWLVLFIVGALLALSSLFILFAGVDQDSVTSGRANERRVSVTHVQEDDLRWELKWRPKYGRRGQRTR